MPMDDLVSVGWHKGELDFRVSMSISQLDAAQMKEFRSMALIALAEAQRIWFDAWMDRPENRAYQATPRRIEVPIHEQTR